MHVRAWQHGAVSVLQFIATMTGHLAWPAAAVLLGLTFKRQIRDLMKRLRRLTWRESAAELAEVTEDLQTSLEQAAQPLPAEAQVSEGDREAERRRRIEQLLEDAVRWGLLLGKEHEAEVVSLRVVWHDDRPLIAVLGRSPSGTHEWFLDTDSISMSRRDRGER
jgi:hypothetical protein